ncbi:putative myb DNA-binding domain-containing protein [Cladorrhinum sp. PSN259]|nr:putative myb DNA-binding domain-containing protein [Cladorrhinum sp. PSN259]
MSIPTPLDPPDSPTPSIPGTPTSTTTSLSALSTTAIKDGHRGHSTSTSNPFIHGHNPRQQEAEQRADRISRLPGLSSIASRFPGAGAAGSRPGTGNTNPNAGAIPTAYFDASGTPVVLSKMSTVGSASATAEDASVGSLGGRSQTTMGTGGTETQEMDMDADQEERDFMEDDEDMNMDDHDEDNDGNESLVGFGEGAGSTISGPVYTRRAGMLRREDSGMSSSDAQQREGGTPVSVSAMQERREARMVDGVSLGANTNVFVDTSLRGPVVASSTGMGGGGIQQATMSGIRETQQPGSHQHVLQHQRREVQGQGQSPSGREAAERILSERLGGAGGTGGTALEQSQGQGGQGERLGRFFFEGR